MKELPGIVTKYDNDLILEIIKNKLPYAIALTSQLSIVLATLDKTILAGPISLSSNDTGADWAKGIVAATFSPTSLQTIKEEQDCIIELKEITSAGKTYAFYGLGRIVIGIH